MNFTKIYHIRWYDNRIVDSRISSMTSKTDEILLIQVEGENPKFLKHRSKTIIKELLKDVLKEEISDELKSKIEKQLERYK